MGGSNDTRQWQETAEEMRDDLARLVRTITDASPDATVFVSEIPPIDADILGETRATLATQYNALIPALITELIGEERNVVFVDMSVIGLDDLADGIHLSADGYSQMADTWFDALQAFGFSNGTVSLNRDVLNGIENLTGTQFADHLTGDAFANTLDGDAGTDTLNGLAGNDSLIGGGNADVLNGGGGNDTLDGGSGGDELSGRNGNDTKTGGGGADTFLYVDANEGTDIITDFTQGEDVIDLRLTGVTGLAGLGIDTSSSPGDTILTFGTTQITLQGFTAPLLSSDFIFQGDGTEGDDVIEGSRSDETFNGLGGNDSILGKGGEDTINGGADNDTLNGGRGNDTLNGDGGADTLNGGQDDDILNGGAGADTLIGLNGNDTLTGGTGADIFVFNRTGDTDTVTDFTQGEDLLRVKPLGITSLAEITQTDVGSNLEVTFGTNTVVLQGLAGTVLVDGDFVFA